MKAWSINFDAVTKSLDSDQLMLDREQIGWLPKSISRGDNVILFVKRHNEVEFVGQSVVVDVKQSNNEGTTEQVTDIVVMEASAKFEVTRKLVDCRYSLLKVKNVENPATHFSRRVSELAIDDYDTIAEGSIFWARSAFGFFGRCRTILHF